MNPTIEYAKKVKARVLAIPTILPDPITILTLNGTQYKLEFDNRAVRKVLQELDINLFSRGSMESLRAAMDDPEAMATLLVTGLSKHHPEVSEADSLITLRYKDYITECLLEACTVFFPDCSDIAAPTESTEEETADPQ